MDYHCLLCPVPFCLRGALGRGELLRTLELCGSPMALCLLPHNKQQKGVIAMEALSFICLFILLPIWGGYTGENMALWVVVAVLLFLPPAAGIYKAYKKERGGSNEHNHKNHYHSAAEHGGN